MQYPAERGPKRPVRSHVIDAHVDASAVSDIDAHVDATSITSSVWRPTPTTDGATSITRSVPDIDADADVAV